MVQLEIACFEPEAALLAAEAGADRIELCSNYHLGGITPDIEAFKRLRKNIGIPIYVMIRPRGGDFFYSSQELGFMQRDILAFVQAGADGFVFGCLNADKSIDLTANHMLLKACNKLPITFHRAIDEVIDWQLAIEQVIELGFNNVLSSGGKNTAIEGFNRLLEMHILSQGKIEIMPGGGIRSSNLPSILKSFPKGFVHSAAYDKVQNRLEPEEVRAMKEVLNAKNKIAEG